MKVGFVTDTHLGQTEATEGVCSLVNQLAERFEANDVETVVHLGDIAYESPLQSYPKRVKQIIEPFVDAFDFYMTPGNHDIMACSTEAFAESFDTTLNTVICRTEETSLVKVNTSSEYTDEQDEESYVRGAIPQDAVNMIVDEAATGRTVVVCTHYPLQYTEYYQDRPIFSFRPEYTFPLNKSVFEEVLLEEDVDVSNIKVFCGHLHPEETVVTQTEPLGIEQYIIEPVQYFDLHGTTVEWSVNEDFVVENMIFEF